MNLDPGQLTKRNIPLVGFFGSMILVKETISLITKARQAPKQAVVKINYFVVNSPSAYNAIFG